MGMRTIALTLLAAATLFAQGPALLKPTPADTISLTFYNDNWSMIFINGKLVAVSPIDFLPHAQVTVNVLPEYPMTIAVLAMDNANPNNGLEYGTQIGDAGFILRMGDGTVSNGTWKTKVFFKGPLNSNIANPTVQYTPIPANWYAPEFDDSSWDHATVYTSDQVKPDGFYNASAFTGASFIWSGDLNLDNTVIMRTTVQAPKGYVKAWNTTPDLNIRTVFNQAQLATLPSPNLYTSNAAGLAMGYVIRIGSGGQQSVEQFAQTSSGGVVSALPISLGPATDSVYLILLGSNIGSATSGTANLNGITTPLYYVGPQGGLAGLDEFVVLLPRSLAGQGTIPVSLTVGGSTSNTATVSIQ